MNNIIMWSEPDPKKRELLVAALASATAPIQEAMKHFKWEGDNLTCGPDTLEHHKEHWRNLYFYLSGYGDCDFQNGGSHREATAIPTVYDNLIKSARKNLQTIKH